MASSIRKIYKDLDLNFEPHPVTGDLVRVFDENSIKQAVKTLILTNFFERPYQPNLGSDARSYLFEPVSPIVMDSLKITIRDVIEAHEPRVQILGLEVAYNEDQNSFDVELEFGILGIDRPVEISLVLNRVR